MKKFFTFTVFLGAIVLTMHLLPTPNNGHKPGAGDIWWANVTEINNSYHNLSQK